MATYPPMSMSAQPGVTFFTPPARPQVKRERKTYKKQLCWLGFVEIILGAASLLLGAFNLMITGSNNYSYRIPLTFVAPGIWCGTFLLFTGGLALNLRRNSSQCRINANMILSIITTIFMAIMFLISVLAAIEDSGGTATIIHIVIAIIASAGFILCIVHAVLCCATTCCIHRRAQGGVLYSQVPQPMQQFVQLANGQYMLIQNPPIMTQGYPNMGPHAFHGATMPTPQAVPSIHPSPPLYQEQAKPPEGNVNAPPPYVPLAQPSQDPTPLPPNTDNTPGQSIAPC